MLYYHSGVLSYNKIEYIPKNTLRRILYKYTYLRADISTASHSDTVCVVLLRQECTRRYELQKWVCLLAISSEIETTVSIRVRH